MVLGRIFARGSDPKSQAQGPQAGRVGRSACPAGVRIYAIGDVHGRLDLLNLLHKEIVKDAASANRLQKFIVYLGDYVDRGLESKGVMDALLAGPPPGFEAVYLKGNHEQAMLEFLGDAAVGHSWRNFGGLETLFSYGIGDAARLSTDEDFERARLKLVEVLPPNHLEFLQTLEIAITLGDYCFVHAGVRPGVPLSRQSEEDLLWIREDFLDSRENFGKVIVHGHTPVPDPVVRPNRIGVDTGAYLTGTLTAVVLEGTTQRFLQSRTNYAQAV